MGTLKVQLKTDLVVAMKARDEQAKSTVRMALAAIGTEEVAGSSARELSDAEELQVLMREVTKRRDSAEAFAAGGRPELAEAELAEAEFLQRYLPTPLSDDELQAIVDEEVRAAQSASAEPVGMKQMGQIITVVKERVAGRAPGATVAAKVKQALS